MTLHEEVAELEHVAYALLLENLLLTLFHAPLVTLGLVEIDHLLHGARAVVAYGRKEEVHGVDAVVVHRVPWRDLRGPALLRGEDFPLRLLDALREGLVVRLDLGVVSVDGGVLLGAALVGGLRDDLVEDRADDGGDGKVDDVPHGHLKLHAARREEWNGERVGDRLQRGARDERERDEEARDCVEHGVALRLLLRLGSELRGELVDAVLEVDHAVHQLVRSCDAWQQVGCLLVHSSNLSSHIRPCPAATRRILDAHAPNFNYIGIKQPIEAIIDKKNRS